MKRGVPVVVGLAVVLVLGGLFALWSAVEAPEDARNSLSSGVPQVTPSADSEHAVGMTPPPETALARAEASKASAHAAHAEALAVLEELEIELKRVEREIDTVERFVDDLEEQGEDPARYAQEGMERLNPVLAEFQQTLDDIEVAEEVEATARLRLEAAEAELEAIRKRAL